LGAHKQWELPWDLTVPAAYALVANRYIHEYSITEEQLAAIPVTQRRHASLHPLAHKRAPITVTEVLASRFIAAPLRLLDCCPNSDGGAALIVSASDAVRDTRDAQVTVLGAGQGIPLSTSWRRHC
jgi:acetyl-CoA acetyltransferase